VYAQNGAHHNYRCTGGTVCDVGRGRAAEADAPLDQSEMVSKIDATIYGLGL